MWPETEITRYFLSLPALLMALVGLAITFEFGLLDTLNPYDEFYVLFGFWSSGVAWSVVRP